MSVNRAEAWEVGYRKGLDAAVQDRSAGIDYSEAILWAARMSREARKLGPIHEWNAAHDLGMIRGYREEMRRKP